MKQMKRSLCAAFLFLLAELAFASAPDKTVVLTFDDAVKSHITVVAPILKELDFGATFFVTHGWMNDTENFMSWDDIASLHEMGFEIGNHSWTHAGFSTPKNAARLAGELALVENALKAVGVPKPVSFAWPGNGFGPEALAVLRDLGYAFARRGMQPEIAYGEIRIGPAFAPGQYDPLLIPTAGDAYPDWTLGHFKDVVAQARDGRIPALQFHGIPDVAHPWVHTPPERFREYMIYLKDNEFNVIALRDLAAYVDRDSHVDDPAAKLRYPPRAEGDLPYPVEVDATRANLDGWLQSLLQHQYSDEEIAAVCGVDLAEARDLRRRVAPVSEEAGRVRIAPYPGGRHPRIGFLDGAIDPQRGTKVSVFPPWEDGGYVVWDIPEAIFSNLGLTFLAHTHIPTIWDDANTVIDNVDWSRAADGALTFERTLPNKIRFGTRVAVAGSGVDALLWLENGTDEALTGLRTQVCAMLKGMSGFTQPKDEHKRFGDQAAAVSNAAGDRWLLVAFEHCGRTWGNRDCPCIHADPVLPDAAPGERVEARGRLWFYEGKDPGQELRNATLAWNPDSIHPRS